MHKVRWSWSMAFCLVGIGLLGLSALLFALPRSASASSNGITEAAGRPSPFATDGTPASPEVNITALSDLYQDGQITLTLQTADPVDPTAASSSFFVNWGIWVNGNSDPTKLDYVVQFANAGTGDDATRILGANSQVEPCTPTASFADTQFSIELPASCIGSPTSIEVAALTETSTPSSSIIKARGLPPSGSSKPRHSSISRAASPLERWPTTDRRCSTVSTSTARLAASISLLTRRWS